MPRIKKGLTQRKSLRISPELEKRVNAKLEVLKEDFNTVVVGLLEAWADEAFMTTTTDEDTFMSEEEIEEGINTAWLNIYGKK